MSGSSSARGSLLHESSMSSYKQHTGIRHDEEKCPAFKKELSFRNKECYVILCGAGKDDEMEGVRVQGT